MSITINRRHITRYTPGTVTTCLNIVRMCRVPDFDLTGLGTEEVKSDVTDQSPMTALSYRELEPGLRSTKVDAVKALDELKRVVSRLGSPGLKAEDLRV